MRPELLLGFAALVAAPIAASVGCNSKAVAATGQDPVSAEGTIYQFKMKDIDDKPVSLEKFKGKVLLVVNVASKCGYTPQYEKLQAVYTKYKNKGFAVLGFPANEFGEQEPGTNSEIKEFCTSKFGVTFPMFSKIVVKGDGIHPLYKWLLSSTDNHNDIEWNFTKFVVGKDGKVVKRFTSKNTPDSDAVISTIEAELAK